MDIFKIIESVEVESINFESFCNIVELDDSHTEFESIANEGIIDFIKGDQNKEKSKNLLNGITVKYMKSHKLKDKAVFKKVELAYGVELPADLKKFIEMYNGCDIEGKYTWEMASFNEGDRLYILHEDEVKYIKDDIKVNFIPLINDGYGNYYGVTDSGKIGFLNHENGKVEEIADTWSNFLTNKNL